MILFFNKSVHVELAYDRGNHYIFVSMQKELAHAGTLVDSQIFKFEFSQNEKQYETYNGINVHLRCVGNWLKKSRKACA